MNDPTQQTCLRSKPDDDTVPRRSIDSVRAAFTDPEEFWSSPLYRYLSGVVATDPYLLGVAANTRAGQVVTFAFFGAVHKLLLDGVHHRLAAYYPSMRGNGALAATRAGPALLEFVHDNETAVIELLRTRLVQTNHVRRAVGLRLALAAIAPTIGSRPAHLLEVGSSAGLLLRQAHYGYRIGERNFGDLNSPVQLETEWRSTQPVPDLDVIPHLASTSGVDLNPLDPSVKADRQWLEALVWPEDRDKAALLHDALTLAIAVPMAVAAGDARDACPTWSAQIPAGDARIVFHCATRMHVPVDRRTAFDSAIDDIGGSGPLYRIAIEGDGIQITKPDGQPARYFEIDGHLAWASPTLPHDPRQAPSTTDSSSPRPRTTIGPRR